MLILTYFSKAATEAEVLFFSERGQILLLRGRRGEITTVIAINSPLVWGEVSYSSSITTTPLIRLQRIYNF
jgi:hypothetical protein